MRFVGLINVIPRGNPKSRAILGISSLDVSLYKLGADSTEHDAWLLKTRIT